MANQFMPEKEVLKLKQEYPPGTRIVLNYMDDKWAVPPGTRGTVEYVDDASQIHPKWDNGRTLAIVPQVDSFRNTSVGVPCKDREWAATLEGARRSTCAGICMNAALKVGSGSDRPESRSWPICLAMTAPAFVLLSR